MKTYYNILFCLLMIPAVTLANGEDKWKGKYTKEKKLNKSYNVNKNAGLKVDNSYGNIDIVTWSENRTVIEVTIKTNGDDEEQVQKRLDEITVNFSGSSSLVTAETQFNRDDSKWNWWGNKSNNVSMEINYVIKLPVTNYVDLNNDYGNITIDRLEGNAKINCDYGQLIIGELRASDNYLNFDYTKASTIDFMKSGRINADYSQFTLNRTEDLEINADYTDSEVMQANTVDYNTDYGKLHIEKANKVTGNGDYIALLLGAFSGDVNVRASYGSIKIERLTAKAKDVTIDSNYTGIDIGVDSGYSFQFDIDINYGDLQGKDWLSISQSNI
ncbi:MAG: hypothetical protein HKM28_04210, partial [Flavobacteriaceae bacterium]|nr:hypothetical protein [Flavobacteriaceae bacterium]